MKTTLNIDKDLLAQAAKCTGITEKTALIHRGLEELVSKTARQQLIKLGGTLRNAKSAPRRRSAARV